MSEEFSAGVKILLQRMETHPEEFYEEGSKTRLTNPRWANLLSLVVTSKLKGEPISDTIYLDPAEIDALYEGYKKIRRKAFDDQIMRTVLAPDEELSSPETAARAKMQALQTQYGWSDPSNIYTGAAQAQALHIAAHQEALMNAYPYLSSQDPHPQPMPEGMLSKMAKAVGIK
jgi:hypothetical protein